MRDTVDRLLSDRAAGVADKPAVIDPAARITYAALDSGTRELAAAFVAGGVGKGTRVGLIMPNGVEWVRIALALTRLGSVLVPLSTLLTPRELVAQLRTASVQALVTVEEFRGHRYLTELGAELAAPALGTGPVQLAALPALRQVWAADALPTATEQARGVVD